MLRPFISPILRITIETPRVKAFTLRAPKIAQTAQPGQFLMVWIPGVDEIPMSIAAIKNAKKQIEFAVARVGDATTYLHHAQPGTLLGLRGPLGHGFTFPSTSDNGPLLIVAGGYGAAPLLFTTDYAVRMGYETHVIIGAKTSSELLYQNRFRRLASKLVLTTEDGSTKLKGTVIDWSATLLRDNQTSGDCKYAGCIACGPEPMLQSLMHLTRRYRVPLQVSLERYMKCGIGICGHCIIDARGTRVCVEGPTFKATQLRNTDFGKRTRDATGRYQQ